MPYIVIEVDYIVSKMPLKATNAVRPRLLSALGVTWTKLKMNKTPAQ